MTWLGRFNQVLRTFHILLVRIVNTDSGKTVGFAWMTTAKFERLGGKFE